LPGVGIIELRSNKDANATGFSNYQEVKKLENCYINGDWRRLIEANIIIIFKINLTRIVV